MSHFIGRAKELEALRRLKRKKSASLVCLLGRRRIGKSALIQEFGEEFDRFVEIQGLGPSEFSSNQDQLNHFSYALSEIFNIKKPHFEDWTEAFSELAQLTQKMKTLILLDEISWMGKHDNLFAAKIKSAWDTKWKKNPNLILVLCGSVSAWIEENILKNTAFEGRISLEINLKELSLSDINKFWIDRHYHMGALEKMIVLSVTGGVPKYLEEVLRTSSASENIVQLCFNTNGFLYNEFDKIFKEIFQRRSSTLDKIVRACLLNKFSPTQLAKKLKMDQNSDFTEALHILEISGFLSRDYYFKPDSGMASKLSHLRINDNYLRFYLKMIEPLKMKIEKGGKKIHHLHDLKGFESLMGLQFENLILANRFLIHEKLFVNDSQIISSAPYIQKKTSQTRGGCQIDLLIHTQLDVFFLCEFKCQKTISTHVIKDVKKKIDFLKIPKRSALKPVLIYLGDLDPNYESDFNEFFHKLIPFSELL